MPSRSAEDPMALARILDGGPDDEDHSSENETGSEEDGEANENYQEIRDAPSPPHHDTSLYDAIYDAPVLELRRLLVQLTDNDANARHTVTSRLLRATVNGRKRKAFDHCENCKADYATSEHSVGACVYHEGDQEIDDDSPTWYDHDPDCHGDPEHPDIMADETFHDGYIWSCCGKKMDAKGCIISRHIPKAEPSFKRVQF